MSAPLRVAFVFAARAIGGAERSMLRLMEQVHPDRLDCRVIVMAPENPELRQATGVLGVPYHGLAAVDMPGLLVLLRRHRPDVLYVFGRLRTVGWTLTARLAGVRCVVAAERSAANRRSDRVARALDGFLVQAYVANSDFAARNLERTLGAGAPPVFVVPNGIAGQASADRPRRTPGATCIVCIGNISSNKGQGVLLEAVRLLRPRYPQLRATLVGRDFTRGRFFAHADAAGLADTYEAVGFTEDVGPFLERAAVVALPTLH
ncbi:MAG TPA: glycosyltransferase, partial [Vicinamibacteria bacterium]|nr:glycosyltransferase [Vicinamibacteria bacterium]